jgi:hypothetical protein
VPRHELLATVYQEGRVAIIAALLIILGAIVLAWRFARGISRPLSGLVKEAESIRHFDFGQTVPLRSYVLEVNTLARTVGEMKRTIRQFLEISSAISGEKHFDRLLPRLLGETVSAVNAAAGVLYLREDGGLKPACAQGIDGQAIDAAALQRLHRLALPNPKEPSAAPRPEQDVPLLGLALSQGRVLSGPLQPVDMLTLGLSELGEQPWPPHAMAVPLLNRQRDLVGAMLILSETPSEKDRASFLGALSGTAAVALEAQSLISEQKALFEAFIELIAAAIDAKSPYTGGHCARVPVLTQMLVQAACDAREGPFATSSSTTTAGRRCTWPPGCTTAARSRRPSTWSTRPPSWRRSTTASTNCAPASRCSSATPSRRPSGPVAARIAAPSARRGPALARDRIGAGRQAAAPHGAPCPRPDAQG